MKYHKQILGIFTVSKQKAELNVPSFLIPNLMWCEVQINFRILLLASPPPSLPHILLQILFIALARINAPNFRPASLYLLSLCSAHFAIKLFLYLCNAVWSWWRNSETTKGAPLPSDASLFDHYWCIVHQEECNFQHHVPPCHFRLDRLQLYPKMFPRDFVQLTNQSTSVRLCWKQM